MSVKLSDVFDMEDSVDVWVDSMMGLAVGEEAEALVSRLADEYDLGIRFSLGLENTLESEGLTMEDVSTNEVIALLEEYDVSVDVFEKIQDSSIKVISVSLPDDCEGVHEEAEFLIENTTLGEETVTELLCLVEFDDSVESLSEALR